MWWLSADPAIANFQTGKFPVWGGRGVGACRLPSCVGWGPSRQWGLTSAALATLESCCHLPSLTRSCLACWRLAGPSHLLSRCLAPHRLPTLGVRCPCPPTPAAYPLPADANSSLGGTPVNFPATLLPLPVCRVPGAHICRLPSRLPAQRPAEDLGHGRHAAGLPGRCRWGGLGGPCLLPFAVDRGLVEATQTWMWLLCVAACWDCCCWRPG